MQVIPTPFKSADFKVLKVCNQFSRLPFIFFNPMTLHKWKENFQIWDFVTTVFYPDVYPGEWLSFWHVTSEEAR